MMLPSHIVHRRMKKTFYMQALNLSLSKIQVHSSTEIRRASGSMYQVLQASTSDCNLAHALLVVLLDSLVDKLKDERPFYNQ